jgi:hypothetical protein
MPMPQIGDERHFLAIPMLKSADEGHFLAMPMPQIGDERHFSAIPMPKSADEGQKPGRMMPRVVDGRAFSASRCLDFGHRFGLQCEGWLKNMAAKSKNTWCLRACKRPLAAAESR